MSIFDRALADILGNRDLGGQAATYTPPGGGPAQPCTILVIQPDQDFPIPGGLGVSGPAIEILVRTAEVAIVAEGGVFAVAGASYRVSDTQQPDPRRLTWRPSVVRL